MDDHQIQNQKFTKVLENAIREVNHEVISPVLGPLSVEDILPIAVTVSKLRMRYLREAFDMVKHQSDGYLTQDEAARLRQYREVYEEALAAYRALEHAINRGYISIKE
jgi:hypothetical protein